MKDQPVKAVANRKPGRPTQEAAIALRLSFLEASLNAFLAHGFAGVSIHDIARAARISRDTFYRQFGSKEEVFRAATAHGLATQQAHLRGIDYSAPPEAVFHEVIRRTLDDLSTARSIAVVRLIVAEAPRFPDVAAKMFADTREFLRPLPDYLGRLAKEGVIDIDDPFEAALAMTTLAGGGIRFMLEPPPVTKAERERYVQRLLRLFLRGWLRNPAEAAAKPARKKRAK